MNRLLGSEGPDHCLENGERTTNQKHQSIGVTLWMRFAISLTKLSGSQESNATRCSFWRGGKTRRTTGGGHHSARLHPA